MKQTGCILFLRFSTEDLVELYTSFYSFSLSQFVDSDDLPDLLGRRRKDNAFGELMLAAICTNNSFVKSRLY